MSRRIFYCAMVVYDKKGHPFGVDLSCVANVPYDNRTKPIRHILDKMAINLNSTLHSEGQRVSSDHVSFYISGIRSEVTPDLLEASIESFPPFTKFEFKALEFDSQPE